MKDKKLKCGYCGHYGEVNIARDMSRRKTKHIEYYCTRCGNQIFEYYVTKKDRGERR